MKRYWFVAYTQATSLGEVTANACIDVSPIEWAATYRERCGTRFAAVIRFAMEITADEYAEWVDHF